MLRSVMALALATTALLQAQPAAAEPQVFVYKGAGCDGRDRIPRFETVMGVKVAGAVDFLAQDSWASMSSEARWALDCWSKTPIALAIGLPMLMNGETSFVDGIAGLHDASFAEIGNLLVAKGKANAYIRVGWEFNGNWYPWAIYRDPAGFKLYFRRIVTVLRATPGQHFTIVWNPSMNTGSVTPENAWPGDDVVDAIGLDVYNQSWRTQDVDPAVRWQGYLTANYGLNWLAGFAVTHNKPITIPEWGTGTRPDGHGWGDDPLFIHNMAAWMRAHGVLFHGYWDFNASDYNGQLSTGLFPNAAAAYTQEFGPH